LIPLFPLQLVTQSAIISALTAIVGEAAVTPVDHLSTAWQDRLQAALTPGSQLPVVVYPQSAAVLAEVMTCAARNQWRLLPCGQGSKLGWGGLVLGVDLVISTQHLNRLVAHAAGDMTVTVEAGIGFNQLQQTLAAARQMVALDPSFVDHATIGGIVASRDGGALRHRYGSLRDVVLGISFVRCDGALVKAGGRVVKNVAGYDLMKLITGSFGSLGVITELTLRLYPQPETSQTLLLLGEPASLSQILQRLLSSTLTPTAVDLLSTQLLTHLLTDPTLSAGATAAEMGLMVRFQGLAASVAEQISTLQTLAEPNLGASPIGAGVLTKVLTDDAPLWQHLQTQMEPITTDSTTTLLCKVGCLPAQSVATLGNLHNLCQTAGVDLWGRLHAGVGLGQLNLQGEPEHLLALLPQLRQVCEQAGGYLTLLAAPVPFKQAALLQNIDLWGYRGNALDLMRHIKQQFDPDQRLSPQRFVGSI
jgi:glycolate oxidase FAD binding subunit